MPDTNPLTSDKIEFLNKVHSRLDEMDKNDLVYRLLKRAEIRRQISTRKSVQEGKPDRISDLLEEAATEIKNLRDIITLNDEPI